MHPTPPIPPTLFPLNTGRTLPVVEKTDGIQLHYEHPHGKLYLGNSLEWLGNLASESVDLVFADPPYNIKKAEWDTFESQEVYIQWSLDWIR